ncbi:MAG: DUF4383 domain-containing protein [Opitutaceae bacterium]
MKQSVASGLTLLICLFFVAEGVWGIFRPVVFGILTTNRLHAIVHIVLGLAGLLAWLKDAVKGYFGFLGSLLIVVSVLWFIPGTRNTPIDVLNVNGAVAIVNFVIGLICVAIAATDNTRRRFGTPMPFPRK